MAYEVAGTHPLVSEEPDGQPAYRNALLAPWPNGVADGLWAWQGERLQLPVNETFLGTGRSTPQPAGPSGN